MQAQSVTLDFLKPVGTVVDLSDKFNARVGDSMTPFNLFVTEGGKPKALNGLHPELEAAVGDGELKDGKVVMSDSAKGIHWVGNAKNVTGYNRLTLTFPAEVFPQSGFCYGHLILANDAGVRESSVDIWFKVLDGLAIMGLAADYYDSAIELELKKLKEANSQAEQRLSKMKATPEGFANLDDLKAKYPNGNSNLNVAVDTGHLWIWLNGGWRDCGAYQSAGYPEVDEARVGAESLGEKKYTNLSEAIHRQINGLSNLGNQAFSEEITGTAGQEVSLPSEYEIGLQAGTIIKIKFDLENQSDLSVIQIYADKNWFTSIEQKDFGKWQRFELDKDIGTLGVVIPSEKFTKSFVGKISFQILTKPVLDLQSKMNNLMLYELPVSLSTSKDELLPDGISGLTLDSGSKIFVRLKVDSSEQVVKNYQLTVNGKFFTSFNDNNWHEVKLTNSTTSLGFQAFQASILKDCDGTFQVVGNTLGNVYRDIDSDKLDLQSKMNNLMLYELPVSLSTSKDELLPDGISGLTLDSGSKIFVRLKVDSSEQVVKNYQLTVNGKFFTSFNDNNWHEVKLTNSTTSLGFQAFQASILKDCDGTFQVVGNALGNVYREIDSDKEAIDRRFSKLLEESLSISASSDSDDVNTTAVKSLTLPKGSKIRVQFSPEDGSGSVEGYQVYANGKYLISYQDVDTWHEITLPDDTDSLGYAFYKERVHGQLKGNFKIIGGSFNDMYTILSSDDEAGTDGLTKNVTTQLLEKEKRINEINDGITNGISFIWMTDPHFPSNDLLSKPSMKHILNHTSIPFVLCGGDYPGAYGTKDDVLVSRDEVLEYQDYIGKGKFFSVQANHDFTIKKSPTDSSGYTAANSLVYNTLIRPNEFYLSSVQAGKEYYYIDIPSQSTRIFMLNSMDGNPETENTDAWGTQYTISQAQADWLVEKAKEKSGWKYVFVCHVPCDSNLDSYHPNEEYFHKVAAAINNKQKLAFHSQNINEDTDFTDTTNQVVTILAGHNHVDQSSSKDGVLSITTTSDAHYTDGGWNRQKDLYSSQAFDVVSVDYDTEQIITTRIGAGEDRSFNYGSTDQGEQINSLKLQQIPNLAVNGTAKCTVTMSTPLVAQAITWSNNCFKWTTSDSSIAEVDNSGVVTAHKSGTVTITVATRDGRHSDYCDVTVK
ncbi:Ig-like domain-containing protein [Limosilactobacillus reuteri]|uniref:Ig-like domain-containing protein n=1 Tax=Limosilactobacillus reuteri TaxID=1598 RepID=UPI00298C4C92|nr:Ig-like domain-containing protein [Limosilactobacillus reuteri]WOZ74833.1 Ig-like domain-containing protein [Limosilactobacillus reuteri]